jgi:hypothetical protein
MHKTRFDIECENFDLYFASIVPLLTPQQKERLPRDITFKLFRKGGDFNTTSSSKLGFIAKLVILWKCLRKRVWVVVEDEENGLSVEQFLELREAEKKKDYSIERASGFIGSATFITASKELGNTFAYLNLLSTGPAYNYLMKGKNKIPNKTKEWVDQMKYICRFLVCYEGNKKKVVSELNFTPPEWYILLCLYDGKEVKSNTIYQGTFKYAYQSSRHKMKLAFGFLQAKGFIEKTGAAKGTWFRITASGSDMVNTILSKYALNC